MALIDEVTDEIKKSHSKVQEQADDKQEKKVQRRHKTKKEIAAYVSKMREEEERRYLDQMEKKPDCSNADMPPKKGRKPKASKADDVQADSGADKPRKRRQKVMRETYVSKPRPKTVSTIDLPDGGSILIVYMPGQP